MSPGIGARSPAQAEEPRGGLPGWVDRSLWPHPPQWIEVEAGGHRARVHHVDLGPRDAPVLLFVHGTPTWSFVWRHFLADLARDYRVVAVDHLGFGLSDRPPPSDPRHSRPGASGFGYRPRDHAEILGQVVEGLGLERLTPVLHDFGGPIGLGWALEHVHRLDGLVLFNTWAWSLAGTPAHRMSRILGGRAGRFLYRRNFSPRVLLPMGFAQKSRLPDEVHRHYLEAFPSPHPTQAPHARHAPWVLARELGASGPWYDTLWERRDRLAGLPLLLCWGVRDPAFGASDLARWQGAFPQATVEAVEDAGHFVQEEAPARGCAALRRWLESRERMGDRDSDPSGGQAGDGIPDHARDEPRGHVRTHDRE
jgi:pimeloyl-ACP methyl ester carboxylesterase